MIFLYLLIAFINIFGEATIVKSDNDDFIDMIDGLGDLISSNLEDARTNKEDVKIHMIRLL